VSGTIASSTDRSDHIKQVTLNMNVAMQDFTTFGDGAFISQQPGLKGADLSIEFNQDFAASQVDAIFGAGFLAGRCSTSTSNRPRRLEVRRTPRTSTRRTWRRTRPSARRSVIAPG
jgi:hypothetical protein